MGYTAPDMDKSSRTPQEKCEAVIWDLLGDEFDLARRLELATKLGVDLHAYAVKMVEKALRK